METQTKRVLSLSDALNAILNKEIYACTPFRQNNKLQLAFKGKLISFTSTTLTLENEKGKHIIPVSKLANFNIANDETDPLAILERTMISDTESKFYPFFNKTVDCSASGWGFKGCLTYIGTDYVTFYWDEENSYLHVPVSQEINIEAV